MCPTYPTAVEMDLQGTFGGPLPPGNKVDDGEPPLPQRCMTVEIVARAIGSTILHGVTHPLYKRAIYPTLLKVNNTGYATHVLALVCVPLRPCPSQPQ